MCEETGRCDSPQMQCIFTAGWAAALCRVSSEQRSAYSFHQRQQPKNSGRGGERERGEQIIIPGDSVHKISRKLTCFSEAGGGWGWSMYHLVATEDTYYPGNVHTCRRGKPGASAAFWQMSLILPSRSSAARSPG